MFKKNFIFICFSIFIFFSCTSTSKYFDNTIPSIPYLIEENVTFEDLEDSEEPYKYVFFRLYNPIYINPLYIANLLKGGIAITEIEDLEFSHASMNTNLNDAFYGITMANDHKLAYESCTSTETNDYMNKCNPYLSDQITYALKVSLDEYDYIEELLQFYLKYPSVTYATLQNFRMTFYSIKRKFFTNPKKQSFGNVEYPKLKQNDAEDYIEDKFLCSTFTAFILYTAIPRIHDWFVDHDVDYRYVNVTDITVIPGVKPLFFSTWNNYNFAAKLFTELNPEFSQYFNEQNK